MCFIEEEKMNMNKFWLPFSEFKKTPASPVPIVILSFSIQTACGIVFFTKQLVCVSLENKKINTNRFWLLFSELSDLLSRKPMHRLF